TPGRMSTTRSRLRTTDGSQVTGVPSACTTRRPSARLPGVWPSIQTSQTTPYAHISANSSSIARPLPATPKFDSGIIATKKKTPRNSRSSTHACARGNAPAARRRSEMPSAVSISRTVSIIECRSSGVDDDGIGDQVVQAAALVAEDQQRIDQRRQPADVGNHAEQRHRQHADEEITQQTHAAAIGTHDGDVQHA